ncbi:pseudouridylate synthase, putative [Plasmodium ovale curtisi]|uniref:Pseudouridylate synthase, putative n=1 Tax=Plasmodium ovale curtisi TaxID=864141 RepID=A0A1A8VJS8_PLAOA|nr:pseudouridylate synthase, putative [Plasmodium ovale curtisi]
MEKETKNGKKNEEKKGEEKKKGGTASTTSPHSVKSGLTKIKRMEEKLKEFSHFKMFQYKISSICYGHAGSCKAALSCQVLTLGSTLIHHNSKHHNFKISQFETSQLQNITIRNITTSKYHNSKHHNFKISQFETSQLRNITTSKLHNFATSEPCNFEISFSFFHLLKTFYETKYSERKQNKLVKLYEGSMGNQKKRENNYTRNKEKIKKLKMERKERGKEEALKRNGREKNGGEGKAYGREKGGTFKKYALCVGYMGSRYHGCQGQGKECMTVENEIERTLLKIHAVRRGAKDFNFCLSRSARTDLGVHALYNVFVFNINIDCVLFGGAKEEELKSRDAEATGEAAAEASIVQSSESNIGVEMKEKENIDENRDATVPIKKDNSTKKCIAVEGSSSENIFEERRKKEESFIKLFNAHLPNDIRCFDVYKVTKSFDARTLCSFRLYEYLFPAYVLSEVSVNEKYRDDFEDAIKHIDDYVEKNKKKEKLDSGNPSVAGTSTTVTNTGNVDGTSTTAVNTGKVDGTSTTATNTDNVDGTSTTAANTGKVDGISTTATNTGKVDDASTATSRVRKTWGKMGEEIFSVREEKEDLTDDDLNRLFEIFNNYLGFHNFHCFTKNKIEQTTYRYIKYMSVSTVQLHNYSFVSVKIMGQSFLMHQIRKMITLAVETFRKSTSQNSISYCLNGKKYVPISLFPPDGLMLICPYFNSYNEKMCNPPISPKIMFHENEDILEFKRDTIAKCIVQSMQNNV